MIQLNDMNYGLTMLAGPFFLLLALITMLGVRRGEAIMSLPANPPSQWGRASAYPARPQLSCDGPVTTVLRALAIMVADPKLLG